MSDVITLANKIAKYKEDIRKAIEARGVECDETTPLSQYAPKIGQIEAASEGGKIFYGKETDDTITSDMTSYTIPDVNYTVIDKGALSNYKNLETVSLTNAKYIDSSALAGNTALENVSAANAEYIGAGCFANDTSLKEISLPSAKKIKGSAFDSCLYLVSVDLPEVTEIGSRALYHIGNTAYTEAPATEVLINMPKLERAGSEAFYQIAGLQSLKLDSLKDLGSYGLAYNINTNFTSLSLPNVENVGSCAFYASTKLTDIQLPSCKNLGEYACQSCSSLKTITIGTDCDILKGSFYQLSSLNEVIGLPSSIGISAFYYCTSLTSIDLSNAVKIDSSAFYYCYSLSSILDLLSVAYIGPQAFYQCSNLKKVWVPSTCTTIGDSAFYSTGSCTLYTDAESIPSGWSSVPSNVVYGATHEDFENA
jgi:hypothetical protein